MFGVAKHIALKMAIKSNYVLQKTFTNFYKKSISDWSNKKSEKDEKIGAFWAQKLLKMTC